MRLTHSARHVFCALSLALTPTALTAQHPFAAAGATFDPRVPTARSVLGYEVVPASGGAKAEAGKRKGKGK